MDLLWKPGQYFQYITILLATKFVIPGENIPLVLFQSSLSFHINLLYLCTPCAFPTTDKTGINNITCVFITHTFCDPCSCICQSVKKWRCGLSSTRVCSIYTVQCEWLALRSELQAFQSHRGRILIHPLSLVPKPWPAGPPCWVSAHCQNSWPHAAGMEICCGWKEWAGPRDGRESLDNHVL